MPLEGLPWLPKADILTYEEIADVVRQLAPLGLRRLRITGGEPTIRPQISRARSRCCAPFRQSRTSRSRRTACGCPSSRASLRDAGLDRVNMSVDSLRPDRIATIARRDLALRSGRRR